jgi:hypothetical protein
MDWESRPIGFRNALRDLLATQNIWFYFGTYRDADYFADPNGELYQQVGLELQQLGPNYDYYLFGLPRVFAASPTTMFLAPGNEMFDSTSEKIESTTLRPGNGNMFVAIPENRNDLDTIATKYPDGIWETIGRRYKPGVLYYAYILVP